MRSAKLSTQESPGVQALLIPHHSESYALAVCHQLGCWHTTPPQITSRQGSEKQRRCRADPSHAGPFHDTLRDNLHPLEKDPMKLWSWFH